MTDRDEIAAWLRLILTPQLGRESARQLLAGLGSAQGVWEASPGAWRDVLGARKAASIGPAPADLEPRIDATLAWLAGSGDRHFIVLGDPRYPTPLLHAPDPPLVLHAEGACERLGSDSIAIVGSRHPTPQGEEHARGFARHLGRAGLQVVSGLARGIDAAAHRGALEGSGGTVAVVGTGLDTVYPRCHARLAGDIVAGGGVMLSEYGLGTPPLPAHFPRRNRIIAGLTRGTLVVEAALRSGSLITARLANDAGRDVFAIPGSIQAPQSRGCHALIKQGAQLVETADDILTSWERPAVRGAPGPAGAEPGAPHPVLSALGHDPVPFEALVGRTGLCAADMHAQLLELELEGRIARLPGQVFQRVSGPAAGGAGV